MTEPVAGAARGKSAARRDELRAHLLGVAEAAIIADGLPELRARALAETAGCSVGAIYNVYQDLDALVLAVNARTLAAIEAALHAVASASPAQRLLGMAEAYLAYAATNRHRWAALFSHRMASGRPVPEDYLRQTDRAFSQIEAPLARLRPDLPAADRHALARTLFSAVHGVVALGLDEKLASPAPDQLAAQLRLLVATITAGLSAG